MIIITIHSSLDRRPLALAFHGRRKAMRRFTSVILWSVVFLQPLFAQDFSNPDTYRTRDLPEGAIARLGKGAIGESDRAIAFTPDGRLVAVASGIGVWLYNVEDPEQATLFPSGVVHSLSFSSDGSKLVTASGQWSDGQIKLWDMATGTGIRTVQGWTFGSAAFSPDGSTVAYRARDGVSLELRDVASWIPTSIRVRDGASFLHCLTFSPDGALIATGHSDGTVILWDVATHTLAATLAGHNGEVYSVAFSPDGSTLATGASDETVKLWDTATRNNFATLEVNQLATTVAFSADGSLIAAGTWFLRVKLWNAATGQEKNTFSDHRSRIRAVSFSPDGTTLASASVDGIVVLRNLAAGNITAIDGHSGPVLGLASSPDGGTLASYNMSYGSGVKIWDTATQRKITTLRGHYGLPIKSISISHDGTTLASASGNSVILWDLDTYTDFANLDHEDLPYEVSFSPDGTVLATGGWPGWVNLWNVRTQEQTTRVTGLSDEVKELEFSPDGEYLALGLNNGEIRTWDLSTGKTAVVLQGLTRYVLSVAFSSDVTKLYAGSFSESVMVWDLKTGSTIETRKPETFERVAFSPDRSMFATGSQDGNVRLFDMSTGELLSTFEGHAHWVSSLLFSTDGKTLVSGSYDGTILFWDLQRLQSVPFVLKGVSGIEQKAPAGTTLDQPFVVSVRDSNGEPSAGVVVTFEVTAGGGTLSVTSVTTDSSGNAATTLTLGTRPGTNTVVATVANLEPVAFTAIGQAVPHVLQWVSGIEQKAPAGTTLDQPFVVSVRDSNGEPSAGVVVTFEVTAGGGTLSVTTDTTDASGNAATTMTLGSQPGTNTVVATVVDLKPVTFTVIGEANPDFDGDGKVGFGDFLLFSERFGLNQDEDGYEARFDLDGNGAVGFSDFLIFAGNFGKAVGG